MKLNVSVIVLTLNEEAALPRCLSSLSDFDEVFVVDSGSVDGTVSIADANGATVIDFRWDGRYPKKKQWALEHVPLRNPWVLFLDADESVTVELQAELHRLDLTSPTYSAFDIPLRYTFGGKTLKHGHRVKKRSLLRVGSTAFPEVDDLDVTSMWEVEGHYQPVVQGRVGRLLGEIDHFDPDPLFDYFSRHNRYSDWEANIRLKGGVRAQVAATRTRQGRVFERAPAKPVLFFLYSYVARSGWKDGRAGFDYATALAFYYWQIGAKVRDLKRLRAQEEASS